MRKVTLVLGMLLCASSAAAQPVTMLVGASFGGGFAGSHQYPVGLTGSIAGTVSLSTVNWVLSANVVDFMIVQDESRRQNGDEYYRSNCGAPLNSIPDPNARCRGMGTTAVYSPTFELGRVFTVRTPVLASAGYRAGDLGGFMGAVTLMSNYPERSNSYIRIAGGRRNILLSIGMSYALLAGY